MRSDIAMEALWMALNSVIFCGAVMISYNQLSQEQTLTKSLGHAMQVHETSTIVHGKSDAWSQWNGSEYEQTFYQDTAQEVLAAIYDSTVPVSINGTEIPEEDLQSYRNGTSADFAKYIPKGSYYSEMSFDTDGNCVAINFKKT